MEQIYASIINSYVTNVTVGIDLSVPLSIHVNNITTTDTNFPISIGTNYSSATSKFYTHTIPEGG